VVRFTTTVISGFPILLLLLAVAAVALVLTPLAVLVFLWRRAQTPKGKTIFFIFLLLLLCGPPLAAFTTGFIGDSRARIERDHSIVLPRSASNIRCYGFVSLTIFLDVSAWASFTLSRTDLDGFLRQFAAFKSSPSIPAVWPDLTNYSPWSRSGHLMTAYTGKSIDGNVQWMGIWSIDANSVGICLVTQWN
jgi:hypothetical protein